MEKVSIVIPIYNASKYMDICLDSVLNQSYKNIEVIAVNDKSTDNSLQILKSYKTKFNNLKIVDLKENKGVSHARNMGIDSSKGDYIFFIDSDDFIDKSSIQNLISTAHKYSADVVDMERLIWYKRKDKILTFMERKPLKNDLILGDIYHNNLAITLPRYVTGKLYKKSVIGDIRFDENIRCYEDGLFNQSINANFKNYVYAKGLIYHYLQRPSSLINTISTNHLDYIYVGTKIKDIYEKVNYYNLPIKRLINNMIVGDIIVILTSKIPKMKLSNKEKSKYNNDFISLMKKLNLTDISFEKKFILKMFNNKIFQSIYFFLTKHLNLVDLSFRFLNITHNYNASGKHWMNKIILLYNKMS